MDDKIKTLDARARDRRLLYGALRGDESALLSALDAGARVDSRTQNDSKSTAAMLCALQGHERCLRALIERGADLYLANAQGRAPVQIAASKNHVGCLLALIAARAPLDAQDRTGHTAAMTAAAEGHEECLMALAAAGADLEITTRQGYSAATLALNRGHRDLAERLEALILSRREAREMRGATPAVLPPDKAPLRI